ncbi:MAG: hypothetical protein Q8P67_19115, partial [archaeon]|nr:hypothetical protein [archaeon]
MESREGLMRRTFNETMQAAQVSKGSHPKLLARLQQVFEGYHEDDVEGKVAFCGCLMTAVQRVLLVDKKEPAALNAINFIAHFV